MGTNDYQFTSRNLDTIDQVLHKLETAVFSGDPAIDDPDPPTLSIDPTGGNIPGGRTVRYKIVWVDEHGAESAASVESVISTGTPVTNPGAPTITSVSTGGTLKPGNYFYQLSAYVNADTTETRGGTQGYRTVPVGTSTNTITLTLPSTPAGADGFNVFRRGPGETQFYWLDSIDMTVMSPPTEYEDDGSITPSSTRQPLNQNITNSTNSITVTVPGATPTVPPGYTWKIYRTFEAGNYNASFLKWVVEETFQGSGIVIPEYEDTGIAARSGVPPTESRITASVNRIEAIEDQLDISRLPQLYPWLEDQVSVSDSSIQSINAFTLTQGLIYSFEGYVMFTAEMGEDMAIQILGSTGTRVRYSFSFDVTGDGVGVVYTQADLPVLVGNSSATPGNPEALGVYITGSVDCIDLVADTGSLGLSFVKALDPATPLADATILRGSWLRVI